MGSLPGDASLAAERYYAHPRNQFWLLVGAAIGVDLSEIDYSARLEALQNAGIALWDVIGKAQRSGSLDQKIKHPVVNNLSAFVTQLPQLRAVAFNGQKAALLGCDAFAGLPFDCVVLPSSSPANTIDLGTKRAAWSVLATYLVPLEHDAEIAG